MSEGVAMEILGVSVFRILFSSVTDACLDFKPSMITNRNIGL